jgi:hypothetical protein
MSGTLEGTEMRTAKQTLMGCLVAAALLLGSAVTAAAESPTDNTAAIEAPLLMAHLRALEMDLPPAFLAPKAQEANDERLLAEFAEVMRWSPEKAAEKVDPSWTASVQDAPAPRAYVTLRHQGAQQRSVATRFPANMPATMFEYSRVRGPFEQVYPRSW